MLKKNDVIKLGRAKFRIRDIVNINQIEEETKTLDLIEQPQIVVLFNYDRIINLQSKTIINKKKAT